MKYDPNYSYDDDEGDGGEMDEDNEDEGAFDEEDDFGGSDDDDSSWKVRKNAVKVLNAIIQAQPGLLTDIYASCADELISRFKEREENVRTDVIACFNSLLLATELASATSPRSYSVSAIGDSSGAVGHPAVGLLLTRLPALGNGSMCTFVVCSHVQSLCYSRCSRLHAFAHNYFYDIILKIFHWVTCLKYLYPFPNASLRIS